MSDEAPDDKFQTVEEFQRVVGATLADANEHIDEVLALAYKFEGPMSAYIALRTVLDHLDETEHARSGMSLSTTYAQLMAIGALGVSVIRLEKRPRTEDPPPSS